MIDNPWFYAVAIPCVILTGISKAGLGIAGGIAVPILALAISPIQAAAIMLPILLVMDVVSVYLYRREWSREHMRIILPAGVLGTAIGWATFSFLDEQSLRVILGLISLGFVAQSWISKLPPDPTPRVMKGFFWGTISGVTSFIAHSGGPPLYVYLLPLRLPKAVHVGTTVIFFAVVNALKIVPYFSLGMIDATNLKTAAVLLPVIPVGIVLGIWIQRKLSTKWFFRLAYTLLLLTGTKLLYDGLMH
jgi:uncharacterized membrane protein YfcA